MCGIVGVFQHPSAIPPNIRARALRILFSELMLRTEPRGDDATGMYQVQRDGDWMMAKKGQKVSEWLYLPQGVGADPIVYRDFLDTWTEHPAELSALVGHCRKATIGTRGESNEDNHPFAVQLDERNAILGVHNGTLTNHETIFRRLNSHLPRQGTVDSEAIFHLLYHATEHGQRPITKEVLEYMGERLDGAYAVITVNTRFPNQIAVFRHERPVEMFLIKPLNIVVIVSEKKFMDSALERYRFTREMLDPQLPSLTHTDRMLAEKDFRIFDTNLPFPEGSLVWKDFEALSVSGQMRRHTNAIVEGWKPVYSSSPATSKAASTTTTPVTPAAAPVTPASTTSAYPQNNPVPAIPSSAGSSASAKTSTADIGQVVDVEVESKEDRAYIKARSLGLGIDYSSKADLTRHFGKSASELDDMSIHSLANMVAKFSFNLGYALSRVDEKSEVDEIRRKGREQLSRMEKAAEKQRKAEHRIWEMKQVLVVAMALYSQGYAFNEKNTAIVLDYFQNLSEERKKGILEAARSLLRDTPAMNLVQNLQQGMSKAERNKHKQAGKKSSEQS